MEAINANITRGLPRGANLVCADNSGAKRLELINVKEYQGTRRRLPSAGVGDIVIVSVKEGDLELRKQTFEAVIIRQKKEFRRPNGVRIKFEDNAAILIDDNQEPRGSEIRGPIAREVADRFGAIGGMAKIVA